MTSLMLTTLLAFAPAGHATHPGACEGTLAAEVQTLNYLWNVFEAVQKLRANAVPAETQPPDFTSYADARRFLEGLVFVRDFGHARQNDAEAVQTFLSWRFARRRDAFEGVGTTYALRPILDELADYMTEQKFAPFLGSALGQTPRWRLDFRIQPHLPAPFWPMVWTTVGSGVLFDGSRGVMFLKYNGFVHVLQPEGEGERVDYSVYKIANRANVSGPLHFAYLLELLYHDLGPDLSHLTELQDVFFHRYPRLRDLLLTKRR